MPESFRIYRGGRHFVQSHLVKYGYLTYDDIGHEIDKIKDLPPYSTTKNKIASSLIITGDRYLIEIFRTSLTNYKAYAMMVYFDELPTIV